VTTHTIYSGAADALLTSPGESTWPPVYAASTANAVNTTTVSGLAGNRYISAIPLFLAYQAVLTFDTSGIDDGDDIDSVVIKLDGHSQTPGSGFVFEIRAHDWGATAEVEDWVPGADMAGKTLLASLASASYGTSGLNTFTSEAAFLSAINKTGETRVVVTTDEFADNVDPSPATDRWSGVTLSEATGTTIDPVLIVESSAGGLVASAASYHYRMNQ
jgi:hypothetical protein